MQAHSLIYGLNESKRSMVQFNQKNSVPRVF